MDLQGPTRQRLVRMDQPPDHDLRYQRLERVTFAYTCSINLASDVDIDNWDSFKAALLDFFSAIRTSRTTTINISTLVQGQNERVINYYIRVADSINDMASLKKLNQQRVPQNPFGPILGALPELVATDVAVLAQVALALVNSGVQDCYDNIALHLFVSGLRPNIRDDANTIKTESELVAALEEAEKSQDCKIAVLKAKINRFHRNNQSSRPSNPFLSTSAPRPPKKAPNPAAKNMDCRYCGRKGHFQLDCNDGRRARAPMVGANGVLYSQRLSAAVDSNAQAHANAATLLASAPPPAAGPARLYTIQTHMLIQI
jgi:hypothetical protein